MRHPGHPRHPGVGFGLAGPVAALGLALGAAQAGPPAAAGDAVRGEALYEQCLACHSMERDRTGPRHCGLVGRVSGTVPEFGYSSAMRKARIVWGPETLDAFLADPGGMVPGTSMYYRVDSQRDRDDLIAWLVLASASESLCPVEEGGPP